jgi:hypothetical protein
MEDLKQVLAENLLKRGIMEPSIPGFLKTLSKILAAEPEIDAAAANARLRYLGWPEVEVDYHLLQIALACFELEREGGRGTFATSETRQRALRLRETQPAPAHPAEL